MVLKNHLPNFIGMMLFCFCAHILTAQNQLYIPPIVSGTTIQLDVQSGTQPFFAGFDTPTYGINGPFMSPTIVVNKGDLVTLHVNNGLSTSTTMHWHGLHVAPEYDGGPHQLIAPGTTWSPTFEILNNAGTYWYHPHGEGKTDLHVSKGLAGLFIIHDTDEQALGLPETYGVDDIPLIVQTKSFDDLKQIAIANHMDTAVFVNGTMDAFYNVPSQVVRFRLLNGSSMRTFYFGFSNDMTFYQIATDGGLKANSVAMNRILLAPGERTEILVDFSTLNGQTVDLMSYGSEMEEGIFGSPAVGAGNDTIHEYHENPLNGTDFELMQFQIGTPTANPVTSIPSALVSYAPYDPADADLNRVFVFDTVRLLPADVPSLAEGPFGFNGAVFDMQSVNEIVPLNNTEIWTLKNNTLIAHPFHIHDIQFNILEKNGVPPAPHEQGWKDVVLVMPQDSVKFITRFETFSNEEVPYMYHCHLLHHEDDGMMGSFIVSAPDASLSELSDSYNGFRVYPNPSDNFWKLEGNWDQQTKLSLYNNLGQKIPDDALDLLIDPSEITINSILLTSGIYILEINNGAETFRVKLVKK